LVNKKEVINYESKENLDLITKKPNEKVSFDEDKLRTDSRPEKKVRELSNKRSFLRHKNCEEECRNKQTKSKTTYQSIDRLYFH